MKCPFRKDDKGEFKDCYKHDCMAYCEIPHYDYTKPVDYSFEIKNTTAICRMTPITVPYSGACNI